MDLKESAVAFSSPAPAPWKPLPKSQEKTNPLPARETELVPNSDAVDNGNNQGGEGMPFWFLWFFNYCLLILYFVQWLRCKLHLICPCAADGYSIYIKGLPMNATASLLENEFKGFGPIRSGGIQVRSNRVCTALFVCMILLSFCASWPYCFLFAATGFLLWICGIWGSKCSSESIRGVFFSITRSYFFCVPLISEQQNKFCLFPFCFSEYHE